jgi:excisionase family DNA binding protein
VAPVALDGQLFSLAIGEYSHCPSQNKNRRQDCQSAELLSLDHSCAEKEMNSPQEPRFLPLGLISKDAMRYLGVRRRTWDKLRRQLRAVKLGTSKLYDRKDLDQLVESVSKSEIRLGIGKSTAAAIKSPTVHPRIVDMGTPNILRPTPRGLSSKDAVRNRPLPAELHAPLEAVAASARAGEPEHAKDADFDRNSDETIDADTAAKLLHCDNNQVESLARRGEIPATKIGRGWIFLRSQLLEAISERAKSEAELRRAGRPALCVGELDAPESLMPPVPRPRGRPRKKAPLLPTLDELRELATTKALEQDLIRAGSSTA